MDQSMSHQNKTPRKGQVFTPDFMVSIVMLLFMLSIFFISWNSLIAAQISDSQDREMYEEGQRTMKTLVSSPGHPEDWTNDTIESIGFADEPQVLNETKLEEFQDLDYTRQRSLLKAEGFRIEVVKNNELIHEAGAETVEGSQVYVFNRNMAIEQDDEFRRVEVRYATWR